MKMKMKMKMKKRMKNNFDSIDHLVIKIKN